MFDLQNSCYFPLYKKKYPYLEPYLKNTPI